MDSDDDDDDDDEDLNSLLADVSAEASSLSRWCTGVQVTDDGKRGSNDVRSPANTFCDPVDLEASSARQTRLRPADLHVEPVARLRPADVRSDPVNVVPPTQEFESPLPFARRDPVSVHSVPLKDEPSLLDVLSGGVGPFRVMAWGTALVIIITLLAYVTTATRTVSGVSEMPVALEKSLEGVFPEGLGLAADGSRSRLSRPRGTAAGEADETADERARATVASLLAGGHEVGVGRAVEVHGEAGGSKGRVAAHSST